MKNIFSIFILIITAACSGDQMNYEVVTDFEADKYLGTWYEIARLDHSFEKGLEQVSAQYSKREDGGLKVINRGFDPVKQEWSEAIGKAYFTETPDVGKLKVSFFGPFYGAYHIILLDKIHYNYAMVTGGKDYLWILSRTRQLTYPIKQELVAHAKKLGFSTEDLIYVNQVPDTKKYKAGPHVTKQ